MHGCGVFGQTDRPVLQHGTGPHEGVHVKPPNRLIAFLAFLAGVALILGPVAVRNRLVGGEWSLSTFQSGPNFYIGNSAHADGRYVPLVRGHEIPLFERRDATVLAEAAQGRPLTARGVSQYWWSRARKDISDNPWHWFTLLGYKSALTLNRYEIADAESLYVQAEYSPVLRALLPVWHFGVLAPLAVVGLAATAIHRRRWWVHYLLIAAMAASVILFFVLARYRFPLAILLIPFAGAGLLALGDAWRDRHLSRPIAALPRARVVLALTAVVALVVNIPVQDESRLNALAWMNIGVAAAREGDLPRAEQHFRRALLDHPESAEGHVNLAMALALQGGFAEAIPHYQSALQLSPELPGVDFNLAVALEHVGRSDEAIVHYQRASAADPDDRDADQALRRLGVEP